MNKCLLRILLKEREKELSFITKSILLDFLLKFFNVYFSVLAPSLKTLAMTKVVNDSRLHTQLDSLPTDLK